MGSELSAVLAETEQRAKNIELTQVDTSIPRVPRKALADFTRDTSGKNVLIMGRWGVKGSISMFISTTGSGKSVLQTQAALSWNRCLTCCGLEPTRAFRTWVIQSEDDEDRVAIDRDDIVAYLREQHPDEDWDAALRETTFLDFTGITGVHFIETLNNELNAVRGTPDMPDAVIINPWNKFFGGDPMSHKDCSAFLAGGELGRSETEGIEAVIKRHNIWLLVFSHTGKPPTKKDLKDWLADPYSCYKMCGSSAVPDAVRSIITFLKVPDTDGLFTFTAGKNGGGLGWLDSNGGKTNRSYYKWGDDERHYWQEVSHEEMVAVEAGADTIPDTRSASPQERAEREVRKLENLEAAVKEFVQENDVMSMGSFRQSIAATTAGAAFARDPLRVAIDSFIEKGVIAKTQELVCTNGKVHPKKNGVWYVGAPAKIRNYTQTERWF